MSRISLRNLSKNFGSFKAVDDLSLEVEEGELIALLGPSGCGKTTTLRMVAGFEEVSSGQIRFNERDVTWLPPNKRNIGLVFQRYALFPHMTVFQNIAYGLEMRSTPKPEIRTRVERAMAQVRLDDFAGRLPKELSGGQQQRVALARALVIQPDVLLLDEPLSNLDAKLRHQVRVEIRQLQQSLNLTTIFVTHDQEEALSVADRLVVMRDGRIEQIGRPEDLYERPATAFVADFIGRSNFFRGSMKNDGFVTDSGDRFVVAGTGGNLPANPVLAVRPERIRFISEGSQESNQLSGNVEVVSYLGPITEYTIRLPSGDLVQVHRQSSEENPVDVRPGQQVRLGWPAEACLILE